MRELLGSHVRNYRTFHGGKLKKTTTLVALLAAAALSFSATPAANAAATKACLALDTGGVDDKSFNASAWAGANADAEYAPNI